jgi:hypothetical protein
VCSRARQSCSGMCPCAVNGVIGERSLADGTDRAQNGLVGSTDPSVAAALSISELAVGSRKCSSPAASLPVSRAVAAGGGSHRAGHGAGQTRPDPSYVVWAAQPSRDRVHSCRGCSRHLRRLLGFVPSGSSSIEKEKPHVMRRSIACFHYAITSPLV